MVPAVTCFFELSTQWRVGPMGGRIGLDNAAIPPTAAMLGIEIKPKVYLDLRTMEDEALKTWARQRG